MYAPPTNADDRELISCMEQLESHIRMSRILLSDNNSVDYLHSPKKTKQSLRRVLHNYARWLEIRTIWTAGQRLLSASVYNHTRTYISDVHSLMTRHKGCRARTVGIGDITLNFPDEQGFTFARSVLERWNKITQQLYEDYHNLGCKLTFPAETSWKEAKKFACHGAGDAISVLLACKTGSLMSMLPKQHRLFGWYGNTTSESRNSPAGMKKYIDRILLAGRQLSSGKYKGGPRPSVQRGRQILTEEVIPRPVTCESRCFDAYSSSTRESVRQVTHLYGVVNSLGSLPQWATGLNFIRSEMKRDGLRQLRIHAKMVHKIMGCEGGASRNNVATIFLDRPRRLRGDDYVVPCIYKHMACTVYGWCFLRRGWQDMYHSQIIRPVAIQAKQPIAEKVAFFLLQEINADAIEGGLRALDRSNNQETSNNDVFRGMTTEQKCQEVVRMLKELPAIQRKDSHQVGNCVPGTEEFIGTLCNSLGIRQFNDDKTVDGATLAEAWVRSKYVQLERFANVVVPLYKKMVREIEERNAMIDSRLEATNDYEGPLVIHDNTYEQFELELEEVQ